MQDNATLSADFDGKLTAIQERAVVSLLSHATMRTAANAVGVDEAAIWRWLQDKDFHAAYMTARRKTVQHALARLRQVSTEAVNTLRGAYHWPLAFFTREPFMPASLALP